ncbi:acyl-CoA thioester hydrolase [Nocardioides terrae]|uniref:Acyl-CoA thioester hydrolase n=2 Tax=Nocardioides terrae TaxID=574651 RepID=A0A1I1DNM3_9ACTN|nr:acyl-CoA thioester hydrolase [Nocardioides terrae]
MRWADLDMLGHVNNVTYVDYLQEARVDMLRVHARSRQTDNLAEGVVVASHQVHYVAPLTFDFTPVLVEVWATEVRAASFTLAYEVFREVAGQRTVYLRATSVLAPYVFATERPRRLTAEERASLEPYLEPSGTPKVSFGEPRHTEVGHYPLHVRFSDVDAYGHVNNVKYFEYFQEARLACVTALSRQAGVDAFPSMVVAQADVVYSRPILFRPEPYDVNTWVARVGRTSLVMESELLAEGQVLSRARYAMVFFDRATERSVEPPADVRAMLAATAAG